MSRILRSFLSTSTPVSHPSAKTREGRQLIAQDTLERSKSIVDEHSNEGATIDSIFFADQLPPLEPLDIVKEKRPIQVINSDAFAVARQILDRYSDAKGYVTVLNLASDERSAGGWLHSLSRTQEEALCYSSTLYATLKPEWYPWPNLGPGSVSGIFSPGVVVFKEDLDHDCTQLSKEKRRVVSVITVAAPRYPRLTADKEHFEKKSDLEDLRGKIRLVYRMAAHNKQRYLVLGAMGCGAYGCPPKLVSQEMKNILLDPEFNNYFEKVVFAVYSKNESDDNFPVFKTTFAGIKV
ncbi:hypothetical protein AGABI1DRAFT_112279 [Agaricus bisporus var. burnettii JB137-S8]|uniref:Microbial-type PARG catalytic domain-containing protein n=1 Tax=Agaricus bisporus var. burnettii (strain JB137-S8 / ATCC MYA-4627 / FGSC 10392) TaxID=597362 RepID=K5W5U7_AGABU|nr:uncharacterized protein AGABI1DRAFT_112279 [Agaricus bisporus var. burnettii JB137-S8]EKM82189.1 hypothetical protein AGABI1DRAFT_112279 [Agaricus bisporus var. burnettii JB137-S8]